MEAISPQRMDKLKKLHLPVALKVNRSQENHRQPSLTQRTSKSKTLSSLS